MMFRLAASGLIRNCAAMAGGERRRTKRSPRRRRISAVSPSNNDSSAGHPSDMYMSTWLMWAMP
jgi:hypothetical protein